LGGNAVELRQKGILGSEALASLPKSTVLGQKEPSNRIAALLFSGKSNKA